MNWLRSKNKITGKALAEMVRRVDRAYEILEINKTEPVIIQRDSSSVVFDVRSIRNRSKMYEVDADIQTCTCPDFCFRYIKCKHIIAAEFALGRVA